MDYKVEWSPKAVSDLAERVSFLAKASKEAAKELSDSVISMGESLSSLPERFQEFPMPSSFPVTIRKCVVNHRYIILYGVKGESVIIYRVLDARRNLGGLLS